MSALSLALFAVLPVLQAPAGDGRPEPLRVRDQVRFFVSEEGSAERSRARGEIDVDGRLWIDWNRKGLLQAAAEQLGHAPAGQPLGARIEVLRGSLAPLLEVQERYFEDRIAKLVDRESGVEFGTLALEALRPLDELDAVAVTPEDQAWYEAFRAEIGAALLTEGEDYAAVVDALRRHVGALESRLEEVVESLPEVRLEMGAYLIATTGARVDLYLPGYTAGTPRAPVPFPRFQLLPDARTRDELERAAQLDAIVSEALAGELGEKMEAALDEIRRALEGLRTDLRTGELQAALRAFRDAASASGAAELRTVERELRAILDALLALEDLDAVEALAEGDLAAAVRGLPALRAAVERIAGAALRLPDLVTAALGRVEAALEAELAELERGALSALEGALERFAQRLEERGENTRAVLGHVRELVAVLRLTGELAEGTEALERLARRVDAPGTLDTHLDVATAGERHVGESIYVTYAVLAGEPPDEGRASEPSAERERVLAEDVVRFRLAIHGFYVETRGALLFTDPRDDVGALGDQAFEPAPGIGFHLHYGFEDAPFFNEVLKPGIGLSLALLDFEDQNELEIGIAGSVTLFDSLLWAGYGRNLQAEVDYLYVGLNPLVLANLFQDR